MPKAHYASMTWPEVKIAAAEGRVVLIPIGAIEQHGHHLPVDTDNVFAEEICRRVAENSPEKIVSMPPIHYGFNDHNMDFPGTISVKMQNFMNYCFDVAHSLSHQGFRRIILVNAHGSNGPLCDLVARRVTIETDALCASINHWQLAWKEIVELLEGGPYAADHACEWETSEYMYLRPQGVRLDLIQDEVASDRGGPRWLYPTVSGEAAVKFMNWWSRMSATGTNGTPSFATADKGRIMIETTIERLVKVAIEFRDLEVPPRTNYQHAP